MSAAKHPFTIEAAGVGLHVRLLFKESKGAATLRFHTDGRMKSQMEGWKVG